jgi:hypothetical protein
MMLGMARRPCFDLHMQAMQPVRVTVRNVGSAHGHHRDYALPVCLVALYIKLALHD